MDDRERFQAIMHYQEYDRMPVVHWDVWSETNQRWIEEGMPEDADVYEFLDTVPRWNFVGSGILEPHPPFDEVVYEETESYRVCLCPDGVIQKEWKDRTGIPQFIDFVLKTAEDWPSFKERFLPDPDRIPDDLDSEIAAAEQDGVPVAITLASMMGWIRNWMGVENMAYLMHDAPKVYGDMVDTLADLTCWSIDQVLPRMETRPDLGIGWEDICFRSGPLVSPRFFERYVAPGYEKIRQKLGEYGIDLMGIDCDGLIEPLLGPWLDVGVNLHYPVEVGVWGGDPMALRRRFGRQLRMVGGFNKLALEHGPAAIDAEIERRWPLVRDGGYIIMPDHHITPGVSLANYQYYIGRLHELSQEGLL
jgi:hypothetical protein